MGIIVLLVIVAVVGAVVIVIAGRTGGAGDFAPDRPNFALPDEPLSHDDIDAVRFAVGMRGYRMDQVDIVMDRLASELTARDRQIAELRGEPWPDDAQVPVAEVNGESVEFGSLTAPDAPADAQEPAPAEDLADRG